MHAPKFELLHLRVLVLATLLWGVSVSLFASADGEAPDLTLATQQSYLAAADNFRRAGNTRQEQLSLTKALHIWPNSEALRYQYALHLVRRKNLSQAIVQTTYTLGRNPNQPTTANLHLLLLGKQHRQGEGAQWVRDLLRFNQGRPPLELWSAEWLGRFRPVLQLGRTHAEIARDMQTLTLIDTALDRF